MPNNQAEVHKVDSVGGQVGNELYIRSAGAISKLCEAMIMGYQDVFPKGLTNKLVNIGHGPNWAEAK